MDITHVRLLENSNENWKIIPQKYFENIGENFFILNMNLDSFKSLENELTKNISAFYKELRFVTRTAIGPNTFL
jgi:hypothetical protein